MFLLVIGCFVLTTYCNACSDLEEPEIPIVCVSVFLGLIGATPSLWVEFYFLNFFNTENRGKRPLHPLVTSTPERKTQNTDIHESKASFVVYKVRNGFFKNFGRSRCSLTLHSSNIHSMRRGVSTQQPLAVESFSYLGDCKLLVCICSSK